MIAAALSLAQRAGEPQHRFRPELEAGEGGTAGVLAGAWIEPQEVVAESGGGFEFGMPSATAPAEERAEARKA